MVQIPNFIEGDADDFMAVGRVDLLILDERGGGRGSFASLLVSARRLICDYVNNLKSLFINLCAVACAHDASMHGQLVSTINSAIHMHYESRDLSFPLICFLTWFDAFLFQLIATNLTHSALQNCYYV